MPNPHSMETEKMAEYKAKIAIDQTLIDKKKSKFPVVQLRPFRVNCIQILHVHVTWQMYMYMYLSLPD